MEESHFSIMEQNTPKNEDLLVTYTPDSSTFSYLYQISKNGQIIDQKQIDGSLPVDLWFTETGIYQIIVTTTTGTGLSTSQSGIYHIDKEKPVITIDQISRAFKVGDVFDPFEGVKARDGETDLTNQVTTNLKDLDLSVAGTKQLIYTVEDVAGNVATRTMILNVARNDTVGLLLIQASMVLIAVITVILMMIYLKGAKLEKRLRSYSLHSLHGHTSSLFDHLERVYDKRIQTFTKLFNHSVLLKKYSIRYKKYQVLFPNHHDPMNFIVMKTGVSILFMLIAILASAIHMQLIPLHELILPLIIGFFAPDLLYYAKYRVYHQQLENDLLQAIIIMNNAFKSGRSITQAIHLVTTELNGPIAKEYEKMEMELSLGLGIDQVFERFAKRIQLEEVSYLTASLSILNKTGGNIIKVFDSIEESLFSKKKLKLELQSLTGGSRLIVIVLMIVPFLFIVFVSLLNPDYFLPFFASPLGFILLGVMLVYYILYLIVVRKIMKVRM